MATGPTGVRWPTILRYIVGAALLIVTAVATAAGAHWYLTLIGFCSALIFILGKRRIFRPGVYRADDAIVCRYVPWYEGNAYVLGVLLPVLGVSSVGAGLRPGNPMWLRFGGIALLVLTPVFIFSAMRMWRRCILTISPSALTVRLAAPKHNMTEIRRELVQSIEPRIVPNGVSGQSPQVAITYQATDMSIKRLLLGLQLSVQPDNLLRALAAWKDGAPDDPSELLDRIEQILRGRSTAGV